METVYKKIVEIFNAHESEFINRNLRPIRMIDIYMGQPESPEEWEVITPAIFINWHITPGAINEPDTLNLDFHVLQEPGAGSENTSQKLDEGLEYLAMLKAVKYLLNKLRAENISPLSYDGERPAFTGYFKYHIVSYKCFIDRYDDSIHRVATKLSTVEKITLTEGKVKEKEKKDIPLIDTFK